MGLFDGTPLERPVTCGECGRALCGEGEVCECPRDGSGAVCLPRDQAVRVGRERRRGKWTTVVTGLDPVATDRKKLLGELKAVLGTGGGLGVAGDDAEAIVLQGDHREAVVERLRGMGYAAKGAGG